MSRGEPAPQSGLVKGIARDSPVVHSSRILVSNVQLDMAGRPTDEVKRPGDPVWTGYRRHGGGSGHNVHRPSRHPLFFHFSPRKRWQKISLLRANLVNDNDTPTHRRSWIS